MLGVAASAMTFLRLPDRSVKAEGADGKRAISEIVRAAREIQASAIFVTSNLDPHCDHQASFDIVQRARAELRHIRVYAYAIWAWRSAELPMMPAHPRGFRLEIKQHLARKRAAIEQHRTQVGDLIRDDPQGFHLDREMINFFLTRYEIYLESTI
jgi:LmbE family N-acetylglucosaminyl deacetylase